MARLTGYVLVPWRLRFDARDWGDWLKNAGPLAWHFWSEATDLRRVPLDRRLKMLWFAWTHRQQTVGTPFWQARATQWWLSRMMRADHWEWDTDLVRQFVDIDPREPGDDHRLRAGLREFLFPEALYDYERNDEISQRQDGGGVWIPPAACYHLRLHGLRDRPGWIDAHNPTSGAESERSDDAVDLTWHAARLHVFRFGDGCLSLAFSTGETDDRAGTAERLAAIGDHACGPLFGFDEADDDPFVPWMTAPTMPMRDLAEGLLAPPHLYTPDKPADRWEAVWSDTTSEKRPAHRIEFPLARRTPCLVLPATGPELAPEIMHETLVCGVGVTSLPAVDPESSSADADESEGPAENATIWPALAVMLLAVFRHMQLVRLADMLAVPGGPSKLGSASYLERIGWHLALARDRFLALPPVLGGWLSALWSQLETDWRTRQIEEQVVPAIDRYHDGYFRDRSLTLVARVTATFWFLFRWILIPVLLVQFVVVFGAALLIGAAALLTLSLFASLALVVVRILELRFSDDTGEVPEPEPGTAARRRPRRRISWIEIVTVAELVLFAAVLAVWPELRRHALPYLLWYGVPLVLLIIVAAAIARLAMKKKPGARRSAVQFFLRETFPLVALVVAVLGALALVVGVVYLISQVGLEYFTLPNFWGETSPGAGNGTGGG